MRRGLIVVVIALGALVAGAGPAAADPARPTNVGSFITAVEPATPAIAVELVGAAAFVELRVRPGTTVTVLGYEDEPYLRFDADGTVVENRNSPAAYLNRNLNGRVDLPETASAGAPPDWAQVAGGGEYAWHDHRVHWMPAGVPPERQPWSVKLTVDGVPATIDGWYEAEPAPAAGPWWLVAVAVALLAGAAGWVGRRRLTALAVVVAAAIGLPVAVAIARLPQSALGDWAGVVLLGVAVVAAVVAVIHDHGAWLAGAGLALLLWAGRRLSVLDHAVLVTSLPEWLDRLAVAVGCGAGVAAVVIGVRAVLRPVSPSVASRPG